MDQNLIARELVKLAKALVSENLISEDPRAERLVRKAWKAFSKRGYSFSPRDRYSEPRFAYEHGQWWVQVDDYDDDETLSWSVVDSNRGWGGVDLDFEEV